MLILILVTNKSTRPQRVGKQKVLRRIDDNVYAIVGTEPQPPKDEPQTSSVLNAVSSNNSSSAPTLEHKKTKEWRESKSIPSEYSEYQDEVLKILEPFASMWDGRLGSISAVEHPISLNLPYIRLLYSTLYRTGPKARGFE